MKRPLFSCVIPVKGPRPYFDEALRSLLSQGMGDDLEIIVQDADVRSGGVGESGVGELNHEIHERHENGRGVRGQELAVNDGGLDGVRWFREADKGQSDALNKGFKKAKGEWLFWLNADDVLLPGALKRLELRVKSLRMWSGSRGIWFLLMARVGLFAVRGIAVGIALMKVSRFAFLGRAAFLGVSFLSVLAGLM